MASTEWKCGGCGEVITRGENNTEGQWRNAQLAYKKACLLSEKTVKGWPVPVWNNQFCYVYRY